MHVEGVSRLGEVRVGGEDLGSPWLLGELEASQTVQPWATGSQLPAAPAETSSVHVPPRPAEGSTGQLRGHLT